MSTGCARGCLRSAVVALLLGGVAYAGFRWGDRIFPALERTFGGAAGEMTGPVPSPGLAEETLDRVEGLRDGSLGADRLVLGGAELSSVIRYAFPGLLPAGVSEPTVDLSGEELVLSALVAMSAFPNLPSMDEVLGLLPDTVRIEIQGTLLPFGPRQVALHVERAEASRIPLPGRMVPGILEALGRADLEGLPSDAIVIPLPEGIRAAYVENDRLILVGEE